MKMMLTQLALLLISVACFAQTAPRYEDMYLEPSGLLEVKRGGFERYDLGEMYFYNGLAGDAKTIYIENTASGKRLFDFDDAESKASRFKPKFFKASEELPMVVLVSLETSYSWGQHIFIIDDQTVFYSGFLAYGADDFNFSNLGLYPQFQYIDGSFILTFPAEESFIDYTTDDLMLGSELKFQLEKDKIIRIRQ
jgi:hypothetical protein